VLVTAHFGNWELLVARIAARIQPLMVLVGRQKNPAADRLINQHRRVMNVQPLRVGASVKGALRALRRNAVIGIAADQDAGKRGIFVEFLGRPASSAQGPAAIALRERCALVLGLDVMRPRGKHTVFLELLARPGEMAYTPQNVRALTERYNQRLADYVQRYPDQWFWVHRKWKTQPSESPGTDR
jgi:KDO2-lipid IV(A) lauroyltransferase